MTGSRLEGRGITVRFGGLTAVAGMDLVAEPGEVTALIGPNGAGKTTLFACLSGALHANEGQVLLDGEDVTDLAPEARASRGMRRTFQRLAVFPTLTVEDNLLVGAESRHKTRLARGLVGLPDAAHRDSCRRVEEVLSQLGLRQVRTSRASTLSTGTLRLVELGRALCGDPRVLMLDEPASGLDEVEAAGLRDVLRSLADDGVAVVLVEHDMELVLGVADRVIAMSEGRLLASGTTDEIRANASVRGAYLGTPTTVAFR